MDDDDYDQRGDTAGEDPTQYSPRPLPRAVGGRYRIFRFHQAMISCAPPRGQGVAMHFTGCMAQRNSNMDKKCHAIEKFSFALFTPLSPLSLLALLALLALFRHQ